jgi:hypothetical protein
MAIENSFSTKMSEDWYIFSKKLTLVWPLEASPSRDGRSLDAWPYTNKHKPCLSKLKTSNLHAN